MRYSYSKKSTPRNVYLYSGESETIMDAILATISNIVIPLTSIITIVALLRQLRGSANINKNSYLLTIDKYFSENDDMKKIYKIVSDCSSYPVLCNFDEVTSTELSTVLTFFENFNVLISKQGILTKKELYDLFGHRLFSILHNRKIQCLELEKYKDYYDNLFMLHEALFIFCIKNDKKMPYLHNAEFFMKDAHGNYRRRYRKYSKRIDKILDGSEGPYMNKNEHEIFLALPDPLISKTCNTSYGIKDCYIRRCLIDDYPVITEVQEIVIKDLNNDFNIFIPTENDKVKEFLEKEDVFFICVQTPDGICAYSHTFFNDVIDYNLSASFKNKKVATFDTVVVLPDFRGNKLQAKLLVTSIEEAEKRNYDVVAATVSPDNIASLNNFIENGFKILTIISYGEFKRYIVYRNL